MDLNLFVRPCSGTIQLQRDRLARRQQEDTRIRLESNLSGFIAEPAALDEIVIVGRAWREDRTCRSTVHNGDRWVEAGGWGDRCSEESGTQHRAVLQLWRLTRLSRISALRCGRCVPLNILTSFGGHSEER